MHLPYDILTNIVAADMQTAYTLIDSGASGRKPLQLIGSPTGFGKTSVARKRFRHNGILPEEDFYRSLPPLPPLDPPSIPGLPSTVLAAAQQPQKQTLRTAVSRVLGGNPPFEGVTKKLFIEARPTQAIALVRVLHRCATLR